MEGKANEVQIFLLALIQDLHFTCRHPKDHFDHFKFLKRHIYSNKGVLLLRLPNSEHLTLSEAREEAET